MYTLNIWQNFNNGAVSSKKEPYSDEKLMYLRILSSMKFMANDVTKRQNENCGCGAMLMSHKAKANIVLHTINKYGTITDIYYRIEDEDGNKVDMRDLCANIAKDFSVMMAYDMSGVTTHTKSPYKKQRRQKYVCA